MAGGFCFWPVWGRVGKSSISCLTYTNCAIGKADGPDAASAVPAANLGRCGGLFLPILGGPAPISAKREEIKDFSSLV